MNELWQKIYVTKYGTSKIFALILYHNTRLSYSIRRTRANKKTRRLIKKLFGYILYWTDEIFLKFTPKSLRFWENVVCWETIGFQFFFETLFMRCDLGKFGAWVMSHSDRFVTWADQNYICVLYICLESIYASQGNHIWRHWKLATVI